MPATASVSTHADELFDGIDLATRAVNSCGGEPSAAAMWLRYRARLQRRLHVECFGCRYVVSALTAAEADETHATRVEEGGGAQVG